MRSCNVALAAVGNEAITPNSRARARLRIQERFVSIQGEGSLAGVPSTFIRVAGCNLRCHWCDSPASSWTPRGEQQELEELVAYCNEGPRHVVLTGGEPLLFAGIAELSARLRELGKHITVETAGTTWLEGLHCDLASISPKLAHSVPTEHRVWSTRHDERRWRPEVIKALLAFDWQLKFVVRAGDERALLEDLEEIEELLSALGIRDTQREHVLLMPECVDPTQLGALYKRLGEHCQRTRFRLGPRLHLTAFGHTPGT